MPRLTNCFGSVLVDSLGASGAIGYCGIATLAGALPVTALGRGESAAA